MIKTRHYLISYPLLGGYMHGYVMTDDESVLPRCLGLMIEASEKQGLGPSPLPIVLQTYLEDGWQIVREVISRHDGEPEKHWSVAKDFHFTAWYMPESDPDTKRLMELH